MRKWFDEVLLLIIMGITILIGNCIATKVPIVDGIIGMLLLIVITLAGMALNKLVPKLPMIFWISLIGLLVTSPLTTYGAYLDKTYFSKINFLSIATLSLAYAGLGLGKNIGLFKELSWKVVVVSLAVYTGTFIGAALISQVVLKAMGMI
jgi:hypothetical protein